MREGGDRRGEDITMKREREAKVAGGVGREVAEGAAGEQEGIGGEIVREGGDSRLAATRKA